ncbi:MAG TPA: hypothetical protein PKD72_07195, partial [Gemmatales bacterium]|nr:hypothetical protein [Gemmatales bacterium]
MGLALAAAPSLGSNDALQKFLDETTRNLGYTFDCTLVALSLSVILMFFIHLQQRLEESLVLDAQQYCLERLLARLVTLDHMVLVCQPHHALGGTERDDDISTSSPAIPRNSGPLRESRITRDFGHGLGGLS